MRYFLLLIFLITSSCFAQKEYQFDHLIEYEFISYQDSTKNKPVYFYTNSKDNSYFAQIENFDSLHFEILILEQDQLRMVVKVLKKDLFKAENLVITCKGNWKSKNPFKFRINDYQYYMLSDTLINNMVLKSYKLQYIAKRKRKTRTIGSNQYIIKDSTEFHLPLLTHPTAYEEWKEERNIPNGIFQEKAYYDSKNVIQYKYVLKSYYGLDKSITVSGNCVGE